MGPPPSRNPNPAPATVSAAAEPEPPTLNEHETPSSPMGPPPPLISTIDADSVEKAVLKPVLSNSSRASVPYTIPEWSSPPCHNFFVEVLKDGSIIDQLDVFEKGAYMFGRVDLCDFVLEHPTISRFHAVIQFKRNGDAYLYDLSSTHGTSINKRQVEKQVYVELHVGDVIRFGNSSRLYIFQGPPELMPQETDSKVLRENKIRQEMFDREASLHRARREASLADGISWGMGEDAIQEEEDDDGDEITWQTYKGQLTEKQEKTREKIIKRTEKIAHMKKEIDAIRAKDIAQGGLTQGQQTQIARNEQRMTEILEELENLEETLNESIRESLGARGGRRSGSTKKGTAEDDEDYTSDEDEFYDRTKKPPVQKASENQLVETADSLLDKRDAILNQMEEKKKLLLMEKTKVESETPEEPEAGDALDAYMSGLSSQLVLDTTAKIEKEISALQPELDRILFLLKIADPSGEAAKKRDSRTQELKSDTAERPAATKTQPSMKLKKGKGVGKPTDNASEKKEKTPDSVVAPIEPEKNPEADKIIADTPEASPFVYTVPEPQWLGAVHDMKPKETKEEIILEVDETDEFVDYKDRQKIMLSIDGEPGIVDSGIENAAPGLIIRKQKKTEGTGANSNKNSSEKTGAIPVEEAKVAAEDAVALLLKHKRGYHGEEDEDQDVDTSGNDKKDNKKKPKRVLGPEKPSFINSNPEYETWVPPKGQSGDGRTSLNDRFGY
ncbi:SMAD/FHA domain-containing protein [Euphorbia peplus]|nr:SMAD/FHA domain-containing protein [Euphorbia peplus]